MDTLDNGYLKQLDEILASSHLSWLFGAGISLDAGIPLMAPLTSRVFAQAKVDSDDLPLRVLEAVKLQLPDDSHIEHILSHLGDYATMAERSKEKQIKISEGIILTLDNLSEVHTKILRWISETIRWGYIPQSADVPEQIGSRENPIVKIDGHRDFIRGLFNRNQAGIAERRQAVSFFTTNYDTLLEDALSLGCFSHWDGFTGGAVAYRSHRYGDNAPEAKYHAHVIKLHGSIDWHLGADDRIWRVRDGDLYPEKTSRVLIYPQATKYLATQRDPFAAQFDLFRRTLKSNAENVLAICGYSFGDEHINQEIELAMKQPDNKTTILAFSPNLNLTLERWRKSLWSKRLYIISGDGLYVDDQGLLYSPLDGIIRDWWKFDGVAKILCNGAEDCVK